MTAAVTDNRDRGVNVEQAACQRWPAETVDEDWYDVEFVDDIATDLLPEDPVVAAGTPGEVKSCTPTYRDRNGRWWIDRGNHETLLEADGVYVLAVVEPRTERIFRMALVDASTVDALVDGNWWDCGNGAQTREEYRQIPWSHVFHTLRGGHS